MRKQNKGYTYTPEQLEDAATLITLLGRAPDKERQMTIVAANSFMIGMRVGYESGKRFKENPKVRNEQPQIVEVM